MCHFKGKNIDDKNFNNFNDIKIKNGHKSDLNKIKRIRNKSIQQKSALYNIETL